MSGHRGRRRLPRPVKLAVCASAAVLLCSFAGAGAAFADDEDQGGNRNRGGLAGALMDRSNEPQRRSYEPADTYPDTRYDRGRPAEPRYEPVDSPSTRTEPARTEPARTEPARTETPARAEAPSRRQRADEPTGARSHDDPTSAQRRDNPRAEPPASNIVKGTPCTTSAVACVSLGAQRAWLFNDGKISYGPISVSTGSVKKQTPVGDHVVQWKHQDHKSAEFKMPNGQPAPMNFAVFFAEGGVAFHEGSLHNRSAGCVRMVKQHAQHFFLTLQLGDKVEVRG